MKTVRVVAAVIKAANKNGEPIIFATQRGYGEFKDGWEFPGGKIEPGETPQDAIRREIMEELDTEISVGELIDTIEYDYPEFHLSMDCFWCTIASGSPVLKEHEAARWLTRAQLDEVEWLPADLTIIQKIALNLQEQEKKLPDSISIRKATKNDIDSIESIYENIHDEEEKGLTTIGWIRNIYPTRKTAEDALARNNLFVMEDEGKIVAVAVINQIQVDEYKYAAWKRDAKNDEIMVLHGLAVDPYQKSKGYGRAFVAFYENYAKEHGCIALRMDTNVRNARARSLYRKLGYEEIGIVKCVFNGIPNVELVCLEKLL